MYEELNSHSAEAEACQEEGLATARALEEALIRMHSSSII